MNQRFEPLPVAIADAIAVPGAPGLGNSSAPIQLLVFWDYECPYCAKAFTALEQVQQRFPNEVRVAVAQYPLPLHPHAALAAEAALSAHAQGRFWSFSQAAFAHQEALERADLLLYAAQAKLDPTKFAKNLDAHEYASAVQREAALGDQAHVAGTPTLYVNRQPCSIPITLEGVTACVDTARKAASSRPSP